MREQESAAILEFDGFRLDRARRLLTVPGGESLHLHPRVFDTLAALAEGAGQVVPKNTLMAAVWPGVVVEENNLNQTVSALRKALGEPGKRLVVTVAGRGYQLAAEVRAAGDLPRQAATAAAPSEPVIAVLAFDNLSGDPDMALFSDGVSDEILLAVSCTLKTIGRASSFQFRGAGKAVRKVVGELGATHILDGSVRSGGGMVRISAQLIDGASQVTLWHGQYDRPSADLFAVQDEIAVAIAAALNCKLSPAPVSGEIDPATYELFLRVRQGAQNLTITGRTRIDLADQITHAAPRFGRGWIEAAQARASVRRNTALDQTESRRLSGEIDAAIARAAELLGPDYHALTALVVNRTPWAGAWGPCETRLRRALEQTPHVISLTRTLCSLMMHSGQMSGALDLLRDVYQREPLQLVLAVGCGMCLSALERCEEAYPIHETGCRRWPESALNWHHLVTAAAREKRWDIVDQWTAPAHMARYRGHPLYGEATLAFIGMHRNAPPPCGKSCCGRSPA